MVEIVVVVLGVAEVLDFDDHHKLRFASLVLDSLVVVAAVVYLPSLVDYFLVA